MTETIRFDRGISVRTFLRPLRPYLDDEDVTEIAIVRAGQLYTREFGHWVRHECEALSVSHLKELGNALAVSNGLSYGALVCGLLPCGDGGQIIQPRCP